MKPFFSNAVKLRMRFCGHMSVRTPHGLKKKMFLLHQFVLDTLTTHDAYCAPQVMLAMMQLEKSAFANCFHHKFQSCTLEESVASIGDDDNDVDCDDEEIDDLTQKHRAWEIDVILHLRSPLLDDLFSMFLLPEGRLASLGLYRIKKLHQQGRLAMYHNNTNLCWHAASAKDLAMLQWARANGFAWDESVCTHAVQQEHFEMLVWARENGCEWSELTTHVAAFTSNFDLLRWCIEHGCPCDGNIAQTAAAHGCDLGFLQWMHQCGFSMRGVCVSAAEAGRVDILEWAWTFESDVGGDHDVIYVLFDRAAEKGQIDVLRFLLQHTNRCVPFDAALIAATHGQFETIRWLVANSIDLGIVSSGYWDSVTHAAVESENIDMLKWAHAQGCKLYPESLFLAVSHGRLDMVQWLCENGCGWGRRHGHTLFVATQHGHVAVLEWLVANGCPVDPKVCDEAAYYGKLGVLKWAVANNVFSPTIDAIKGAIENEFPRTVRFLLEHNAPVDDDTITMLSESFPDIVHLAVAMRD